VSNPDTLAAAVAADDVIDHTGPRGARPRRTLSRGNIFLHVPRIVVALYY
jgi:hypothetical protein